MDKLRTFLNSMTPEQQEAFAKACGTSVGYLRKAISTGQQLGESLCINIDCQSNAAVHCEDLRPDVNWAHLRGSLHINQAA
jgi:DNA-binding transcriptional regulator YdaS (Cro superfamily)